MVTYRFAADWQPKHPTPWRRSLPPNPRPYTDGPRTAVACIWYGHAWGKGMHFPSRKAVLTHCTAYVDKDTDVDTLVATGTDAQGAFIITVQRGARYNTRKLTIQDLPDAQVA